MAEHSPQERTQKSKKLMDIQAEVAKMNKIGFELPKNLKNKEEVIDLNNLAAVRTFDFDEVVFYSEQFGILEFEQAQNISNGIGGAIRWTDKDKRFLFEVITYDDHYYVYRIGEYQPPEIEEK